jgi:peptide chain release factor subunit 1
VLILTPVKDAYDCLPGYERRVRALTYPHSSISLGLLESDSVDGTWTALGQMAERLRKEFAGVTIRKKDFGYQVPAGLCRSAQEVQFDRRVVLAKSRNHLLFHALREETWVLWLDVDVVEYPPDIIQRLLAVGKQILHPNCVRDYGGKAFDLNAWRDQGTLTFDQLRGTGELVELDAVGGTMLLIRADLHRDGLIFPPFRYGEGNSRIRHGVGELETEGLGIMAADMGHQCWGMPGLEVLHGRW